MRRETERGWRFLVPDIEAPTTAAGLAVSARGGVDMIEGEAGVRQALLLLLLTVPGERLMRPDYGCNLRHLCFWQNDATTAGLAIHYVRQALARWEPRIEIVRLDAVRNEAEPSRLDILLDYRLRETQRTETFALSLDLMSPEGP